MEFNRKKVIIGLGLLILTVSLVLLLNRASILIKGSNFSAGNSSNAESRKSMNENLDTDNDGLPDRVEKTIGANPEKKDTDGDGYGDLEEIKNGYSPLAAGAAGKFSMEESNLLKEKIKSASPDLYQKIFGGQSIPDASNFPIKSPSPAPAPPKLSGPAVFKEEVSLSNKDWKYSFYAPADIDLNKEQTLLIGLHGFEGKAKDYIQLWRSDADKNGFLAAVLQAYPKKYPNGSIVESYPWLEISDFAKAALANIKKNYKINDSEIFLTGYSAGAPASYIIALDSGLKFKGVIPIDGYLPLEAGLIDKLSKAGDINFYIVHGADDAETEAVMNQEKILLQYGAKMEFKILPDMGTEYPAAEHENIVKWMEGL